MAERSHCCYLAIWRAVSLEAAARVHEGVYRPTQIVGEAARLTDAGKLSPLPEPRRLELHTAEEACASLADSGAHGLLLAGL